MYDQESIEEGAAAFDAMMDEGFKKVRIDAKLEKFLDREEEAMRNKSGKKRNKSGKKRDVKGEVDQGTGEDVPSFVDLVRSQSSIEVKRDAKGNVTLTVKVYADTVEEAEEKAADVFERLNQKFKSGD